MAGMAHHVRAPRQWCQDAGDAIVARPLHPRRRAGDPQDEEEAANLQEIFDAGVTQYGPDPSKWPPEFTAVPAAAEAIKRYKESMGQ